MGTDGPDEHDPETVSELPSREHAGVAPTDPAPRPSGPWRIHAAEAFAPGTVVDSSYRILDRLGEGAMGIVLRAHDIRLDRDVAIKVIRPSVVERPDARERFLREARAMAHVRHPNVVEVHALGEWHALPYIVMEYIHGMTLDEWLTLREGRPLALEEGLSILDQLCLGVEAIHASGAAHRDLKPSNVLVGAGFRVAVADFGISRSLADAGLSASLGSGTPAMMAPEVVLGTVAGAHALAYVDVYALGILGYRLLVGRFPFEGRGSEVMAKQVSDPPPPPRSLRPDLPAAFEQVLLDALAKSPRDRIASVSALRAALQAAREAARRPAHQLRFLVAEDDPAFRGLVTQILLRGFPGATVEQAPDGVAALAAAERNPPSALLSDLDMPSMSGLELTAAVRASPRLAKVPIVIMTGKGTPADWQTLSRLGANALLVKPFDSTHAIALLRALIDVPHKAKAP